MKVVKSTGFVPVKFLYAFPPYGPNEIAGLTPAKIHSIYAEVGDGKLPIEIQEPPSDVETFEVPDPVLKRPRTKEAELEEARQRVASLEAELAAAKSDNEEPSPASTVEIPADWDKQPELNQISLAKKIKGLGKKDALKADEARTIISEEIALRAAAADPTKNSGDGAAK